MPLKTEDLQPFVGGQIQVTTKRTEDHHATYRAEISQAEITADNVLVLNYSWSAFGEGEGNLVHWAFDGRTGDQFTLIDFDDPAMHDTRLLIKNREQTIFFFPAGDSSLIDRANVRQPQTA